MANTIDLTKCKKLTDDDLKEIAAGAIGTYAGPKFQKNDRVYYKINNGKVSAYVIDIFYTKYQDGSKVYTYGVRNSYGNDYAERYFGENELSI